MHNVFFKKKKIIIKKIELNILAKAIFMKLIKIKQTNFRFFWLRDYLRGIKWCKNVRM